METREAKWLDVKEEKLYSSVTRALVLQVKGHSFQLGEV